MFFIKGPRTRKNKPNVREKILLAKFKPLLILFISLLLLKVLIESSFSSLSDLCYGLTVSIIVLLILEWCIRWFSLINISSKEIEGYSKRYDIQFKRLAKYLLFVFILYILCGIVDYKEKNKGFVINDITLSKSFESYGYDASTLRLRLQEIKEEISDFEYYSLPTKRFALASIPTKDNEQQNIDFQVQGFSFSLKDIGKVIGQKLWGDKKKYITIALTEDTLSITATINITGIPIKNIQEFYENNINKSNTISTILKRIEYYIIEFTEPTLLAIHYSSQGKNDKALSILANYNDINIDSSDFGYYRAKSYIYQKLFAYEKSNTILDKLLKFYPKNITLLNDKGWIELDQNNLDKAQEYFKLALSIDSNAHYPNKNRALFFYKRNNLDSAIFYLERATKSIDPSVEYESRIWSLFALSYLYRVKEQFELSEKVFFTAINKSPYSHEMLQNTWPLFPFDSSVSEEKIKKFYTNHKHYIPALISHVRYTYNLSLAERERIVKECLLKNSELMPIQLECADILYAQKKYGKGDSIINRVIAKQPENYVAYYIKGISELQNENYYDAENHFRQSLSINKFYQPSIESLVHILAKKGNEDELMSLCQNYYYLDPYNTVYTSILGSYYYERQINYKAIFFLNLAEKNNTNTVSVEKIQLMLAEIYYNTNDYNNSAQYYAKVIKETNDYNTIVDCLLQIRQCYIQLGDNKRILEIEAKLRKKNISFDYTRTIR